jgi:hypothetical protein
MVLLQASLTHACLSDVLMLAPVGLVAMGRSADLHIAKVFGGNARHDLLNNHTGSLSINDCKMFSSILIRLSTLDGELHADRRMQTAWRVQVHNS